MNIRRRFVLIGLFAFAIALYEIGMRTFFSIPYAYFFPALGVICLGLLKGWNEEAFIFAFIIGGLHDLFDFRVSFLFAGLPFLVVVLRFVSLNVMTNRSMYSVIALVLLGRYGLWVWEAGTHVVSSFFMENISVLISWSELWRRSAWDVVFVSICFVIPIFLQRVLRLRKRTTDTYGSLL